MSNNHVWSAKAEVKINQDQVKTCLCRRPLKTLPSVCLARIDSKTACCNTSRFCCP